MNRRVGVRQWLILGALAQMPHQSMYGSDMRAHIWRCAPGTSLLSTLGKLEAAGLIVWLRASDVLELTEAGATARCEARPTGLALFAPVPRSVMASYYC